MKHIFSILLFTISGIAFSQVSENLKANQANFLPGCQKAVIQTRVALRKPV
jgi:hypothetical protein